jgi:hypothetical protein
MLMMKDLDHEEIKKRIKSVLRSIPSDVALNLHLLMHPDNGFIEMVSAPTLPLPFFPLAFLHFLSITRPQNRAVVGESLLGPRLQPTPSWGHGPEGAEPGSRRGGEEEEVQGKKEEGLARPRGRRSARSVRGCSGRPKKRSRALKRTMMMRRSTHKTS